MAEFLLDTEAASRLMRAERSAITNMRQSGAKTVSFLARILIHPWDEAAAEAHARIRIVAKRAARRTPVRSLCRRMVRTRCGMIGGGCPASWGIARQQAADLGGRS